jgi:hypothetical protein
MTRGKLLPPLGTETSLSQRLLAAPLHDFFEYKLVLMLTRSYEIPLNAKSSCERGFAFQKTSEDSTDRNLRLSGSGIGRGSC